ncbi:MAG: response regulator [Deltaproteobacteria bacterium]|nr:response regulator [Deltaproteobacteria bacterium]
MGGKDILTGKKILVVDDEEDVVGFLETHLEGCKVETALSFEGGKKLLENKRYDAAILDIMGVDGLNLLEIARKKGISAIMLTAHSIFPDSLVRSIKLGANSFIPKDRIYEIDVYLKEIFLAQQRGIKKSGNWFAALGAFFDKRFGPGWKDEDKGFWDEFHRDFVVTKDDVTEIL